MLYTKFEGKIRRIRDVIQEKYQNGTNYNHQSLRLNYLNLFILLF